MKTTTLILSLACGTISVCAAEPGWTLLQLSVGPGEVAWFDTETAVSGVRLGLFADNRAVDGFDFCLIGARTRERGSGIQWGTFEARCEEGPFHGLQVSPIRAGAWEVNGLQVGGYIRAEASVRGGQIGLACSAARVTGVQMGLVAGAGSLTGVQLGLLTCADDLRGIGIGLLGAGNWHGDEMNSTVHGLQLCLGGYFDEVHGAALMCGGAIRSVEGLAAGLVTQAGTLHGVQLGGLCQTLREMHGVQLGLVNYAGHLQGLQIGLVNISRDGGLPVSPIVNWAW